MGVYVLVFGVAVVLWVVISLILVMGQQSKTKKQTPTIAEQQRTTEQKREVVYDHLRETKDHSSWKQKLENIPGVLGWILLHLEGRVIESSDQEESAETCGKLAEMIRLARQMSEELGVTPTELLEWEGSQGSILVAFPKQVDDEVHLVLFLDTDVYKNQIRDVLIGLNWEADLVEEPTQPHRNDQLEGVEIG